MMDSEFQPAASTESRAGTPTSFLVFHSSVSRENLRRAGSADRRKNDPLGSAQAGAEKGISQETGWQSTNRSKPPSKQQGGNPRGKPPDPQPDAHAEARSSDPPGPSILKKHPKMARSFRRALVDSAMLEAYEASTARNCCYEAKFAASDRHCDEHGPSPPE